MGVGAGAGGSRRRPWLLGAIVLLAAGLRGAGLDRMSLFYDEVVVMRLARQGSPAELMGLLGRIDATRAPLHPLLLQGWVALFGPTAAAGRAFSVLCGVLTVVPVYRVGREAFDRPTALWGAFLYAISPMQVRYAQEVRMYALLVLVTCAAWALLLSFRRAATPGGQVAYAGCLVALAYLHPLGLFMIAALAAAYLANRGAFRLAPGRWAGIQAVALVAIAPWAGRYLDHGPEITVGRLPVKFLVGLPIGFTGGNGATLAGFVALAAWGALKFGRGSVRLDHPVGTSCLLAWFGLPPLLLWAYSRVAHPIFGPPRYTLFVGPAYLLLVARGLAKLPVGLRLGVAAACVALAGSMLRTLVYASAEKPDWRSAAAVIRRVDAGAPVVVLDAVPGREQAVEPIRYYLGATPRVVPAAGAGEALGREPAAWAIVEEREGLPKPAIPEALGRGYEPVGPPWRFNKVRLDYYRGRPGRSRGVPARE